MSLNAHRAIAAAIDNDDVHTIISVPSEMFGENAQEFEFVRDYYSDHGVAPSRELMKERFGKELPEINGVTEHYLNSLRDSYIKIRMSKFLSALNESIGTAPASALIAEVQKAGRVLDSYSGGVRDVNMNDVEDATEYLSDLRAKALENGAPGLMTGFDYIDASYPTGLMGGHFNVVIGYAAHGKSLFSAKLGVNALKQKRRVLIISLEMTPEEYRERVYTLIGEGRLSMSDLARGEVPDDFDDFAEEHLKNSADFIVASTESLSSVTPSVVQAKMDVYKPDLVILDYMQLMDDEQRSVNMTQKMMNLSRELKLLAMRNSTPIVALSAVTDDDGKKRSGPPQAAQIAWSRSIESNANLILSVHKYKGTNLIHVQSVKVRNGQDFDFVIEADIERGIWTEKATDEVALPF